MSPLKNYVAAMGIDARMSVLLPGLPHLFDNIVRGVRNDIEKICLVRKSLIPAHLAAAALVINAPVAVAAVATQTDSDTSRSCDAILAGPDSASTHRRGPCSSSWKDESDDVNQPD